VLTHLSCFFEDELRKRKILDTEMTLQLTLLRFDRNKEKLAQVDSCFKKHIPQVSKVFSLYHQEQQINSSPPSTSTTFASSSPTSSSSQRKTTKRTKVTEDGSYSTVTSSASSLSLSLSSYSNPFGSFPPWLFSLCSL
jgi:hypothetical protein